MVNAVFSVSAHGSAAGGADRGPAKRLLRSVPGAKGSSARTCSMSNSLSSPSIEPLVRAFASSCQRKPISTVTSASAPTAQAKGSSRVGPSLPRQLLTPGFEGVPAGV